MATPSTSTIQEGLLQSEVQGFKFRHVMALFVWLGAIHVNAVFCLVCFLSLPNPWAITALGLWTATIFIPTFTDSKVATNVATFVAKNAPAHFPMQVHTEALDAFDSNRSYVVAVEPHSVLPIGIVVLTAHYGLLPLTKIKGCATSVIFWTPILRHIWTWMGLIPASKAAISKQLKNGVSTVLIPGGVQECLYLKRGQETIFLKRRFGFLRLAMEAGSPLVPCFCFGQSEIYHYWRPSGTWFSALSRAIGFTPMFFWGIYGGPAVYAAGYAHHFELDGILTDVNQKENFRSPDVLSNANVLQTKESNVNPVQILNQIFYNKSPIPFPHPMYFVVGKPIEVEQISDPSNEQVIALQATFIQAMEELFERHKSRAGYGSYTLNIK